VGVVRAVDGTLGGAVRLQSGCQGLAGAVSPAAGHSTGTLAGLSRAPTSPWSQGHMGSPVR